MLAGLDTMLIPGEFLLRGVRLGREPFLEPDFSLSAEQQHELDLEMNRTAGCQN